MATRFDIDASDGWFIGEDKTIEIDVVQSDGSTAQTMTGWALTWELKRSQFHSTVLISKTTASGISIGNGDGTDDRASITVADTDTEDLEPGTYYHQLRRSDAGSEVILSRGDAVILESGL